jgi:hypothetical protein
MSGDAASVREYPTPASECSTTMIALDTTELYVQRGYEEAFLVTRCRSGTSDQLSPSDQLLPGAQSVVELVQPFVRTRSGETA